MSKGIFAEWLVETMKAHSITAATISSSSGFHHNVVRNWMRGRSLPNSCSMVILIDVLAPLTKQKWDDLMREVADLLRKEGK